MKFETANAALKSLAGHVLEHGAFSAPRSMGTIEVLGASFVLANPRARIITLPARKFSLALAVGELAWHCRGDDDVEALAYYAKAWSSFSDDGDRISGSCYGRKLLTGDATGISPWRRLANLLRHDPSTRRATFAFISNDEDVDASKDISCVTAIQFLIRGGRIDLFTFMRSNDLFLGLPYDVFLFTSFLEMMALELGLPMGEYHHFATSLHIYDRDIAACRAIAEDQSADQGMSPPATSIQDFQNLAEVENAIRSGVYMGDYRGPFVKYVAELSDLRGRKVIKRLSRTG